MSADDPFFRKGDTVEIFPHPTIPGAGMCRIIRADAPVLPVPGVREKVEEHLRNLFYEAAGCQALYGETGERMDAMRLAVTRTTNTVLDLISSSVPLDGEGSFS